MLFSLGDAFLIERQNVENVGRHDMRTDLAGRLPEWRHKGTYRSIKYEASELAGVLKQTRKSGSASTLAGGTQNGAGHCGVLHEAPDS